MSKCCNIWISSARRSVAHRRKCTRSLETSMPHSLPQLRQPLPEPSWYAGYKKLQEWVRHGCLYLQTSFEEPVALALCIDNQLSEREAEKEPRVGDPRSGLLAPPVSFALESLEPPSPLPCYQGSLLSPCKSGNWGSLWRRERCIFALRNVCTVFALGISLPPARLPKNPGWQ